jgi:broad specificity phosphatase PhoE
MVTIIFESHATSLDNEANISSGHYDVDLSELGLKQARELGDRYKTENFDAIFCSDLLRSYRTGEIAFGDRNFKIYKDRRLREINAGQFNRHPKEEVEGLKTTYISVPFPYGESYEQTTAMIKDFLQELLRNYDGKKVMIIGSRATQYGLEYLINKVPLEKVITDAWQWQSGWTYYLNQI